MKTLQYIAGLAVMVSLLASTPTAAYAQTKASEYQPQTIQEMIAYLYGIIAQLQAELNARQGGTVAPSTPASSYDIDVSTLSARNIEDDEATVRANIDLDGASYATVWFEYGESSRLGDRTSKTRITNRGDDTRSFSRTLTDLDEDEKYYYQPIAEGPDGKRVYGTIRSFTTDDDRDCCDDDDDDDRDNNDDFELRVSDTRINEGDEIEVDWEIPSDEIGSGNWIGLYEVGDSNRDYISWKYIDNDDDTGTVEFTITDEGEYEFRLFLDNGYDDKAESREIEVE